MSFIDRNRYQALYGPTAGDRIRLADTDLWIEVTADHFVGADETVFGGGKAIRAPSLVGVTAVVADRLER